MGAFPRNESRQDLDDWLEMIETVLWEGEQHLLWLVQIVKQHVKRVKRLEQVVERYKLDVSQVWVHYLLFFCA